MDAGVLIPVVATIFGCGIPLSAIWTEYLRDRALIEKGLYQPKQTLSLSWLGIIACRFHSNRDRHSSYYQCFRFPHRQGDWHSLPSRPIYWGCINSSLFYYQREKADI